MTTVNRSAPHRATARSTAARLVVLGLLGATPGGATPGRAQQPALPPPPLPAEPTARASSLVFHGVTVVDVRRGRLLPAQTVVITGPRVQAVSPAGAVAVPPGAQVVPVRGKYLIPGLWDMHMHP